MLTFLLIPVDINEPMRFVVVEGGDTLDALQKAVGGYVEAVPHSRSKDVTIYCNEEGKLLKMLPNARAQVLWASLWGTKTIDFDYLVGPVVVLGPPDDEEGESTNVPMNIRKHVERSFFI